jgi:signal transduction histidine kinase/DNA-binding response OmpR family regulator/ligand-binding sensor domain-containing protein
MLKKIILKNNSVRNSIYTGIILFTFLLVNQEAYAQYVFRHIDVVDGLSDNQIRYFTEMPDGRLAIRTVSILNIYNSATFEHLYHNRKRDYKWSFNRYQIFKDYHDAEGRLWMKAPGYLTLFDRKTNQFIYNIDSVLCDMGICRKLKNLFIDENKNYWFLTEDNTFSYYDISKKELRTIDAGNSPFALKHGIPLEIAQYKNLYWIVYSSGLLRCWDISSREFVLHDTVFTGKISDQTDRLFIHPTASGDLWLMYNNAVAFYNRIDKVWKEVATIKGPSNFFTSMDMDMDGNVWVGSSWSGLRKIDGKTHEVESIPNLNLTNGLSLNNDIQCIFIDRNNGLWIGTLWQGICYYHPSMSKFRLIQTVRNDIQTANESVRCLLEDNDGSILIGTTYKGLLRYKPETGKMERAFDGLLSDDLCLSLYRDRKNRLWVGTYLNGFYCIDKGNVKIYNKSSVNLERYPNQNVSRAIYEDLDGRFWVSVGNEGAGELDINTGKITMLRDKHPEIAFHKVDFDFYPIDDYTFAVFGESGIYYYDTQKDKIFIPEIDDPDNLKFMGGNVKYYCVFKDSRSLEWFGTELGIHIWDNRQKKAYSINTESGLPSNSVSAIEEDDNGIYWISTLNGITKIEVRETANGYTFSLVNFDTHDGLQSGKFYDRSSLKTQNGDLYFGGHHGINTFNPDNIRYNSSLNKPVFTTFKLFNSIIKENTAYNGHVILQKPISNTRELNLNYKENFFTFEFSGLNYVNPSHTYFRYKLENYDLGWNEVSASGLGSVSYTGLTPGEYKLIVYTANNDKIWGNEAAEIAIIITPPFYATVYAYILYALLTAGIFSTLFLYLNKKHKRRTVKRQTEEKRRQEERLNQMKLRFFTNISHEFRTPLTLIMTPLSTLIHQLTDENLRQKLSSIYRNAEDMLGLINQLLDFRKLEMGGEKLNLQCDDFVKFTEYVYFTFKDVAENKSIQFTFESDVKQLFMGFDKSKVRKIINNLYSNALKFTPEEGHIATTIGLEEENGREFVRMDITDSGCGIPDKEKETIFERFYQSEYNSPDTIGSGLGLHLVKGYVELHGGLISVSSKPGEGSVFTVYIPADLQVSETVAEIAAAHEPSPLPLSEPEYNNSEKKTLLIVEDNTELRRFLSEQLSGRFNVLEAADGKQGTGIALKKFPDLIVSDLMMPVLNGLELCQRLKNDIHTSHIPVILLTARLSDESKIESYKAGADSYIAKPFSFEVLLARIEMLIEQQEKRKELFHKTVEITPSSITVTSLDEEFIRKALQLIEENISNPDYSNDNLSKDMGMSRSSLYPKFQSLIGQTPNHFIRSIRLKRAAQLLQTSQFTISEISYMVGVNDIKYFNKYFKEDFGKTPTQYRTENKNPDTV